MIYIISTIAVLWLVSGIICLYHMDYSIDTNDTVFSTLVIIGVVILVLLTGPLLVRAVLRHNYS